MNTACEACLATHCAQEQCVCLTDTNVDDAGIPECGVYVNCLYGMAAQALASDPDAGLAGLSTQLPGFESSCGMGLPSASSSDGNGLVGCFVNFCGASCF